MLTFIFAFIDHQNHLAEQLRANHQQAHYDVVHSTTANVQHIAGKALSLYQSLNKDGSKEF